MADIIVIGIIILLVGAALLYIRKEKKKGVTCIGCSAAGTCGKVKKNGSGCGCHNN